MKVALTQLWTRFQAYRAQLSVREQYMLFTTAGLALIVILYWGGWKPLSDSIQEAHQRYVSEQALNLWVSNKANMITQLRKSGAGGPARKVNQPFNQVISTSTAEYQIQLIRIQPRDDSNQIWVDPLPFDRLLDWLSALSIQHGIQVESLDIERTESPGVVKVNRLVLH